MLDNPLRFYPANMLDVLIIGGSYAGLSAALALGRARRSVLVLDARRPRNRFTPHAHNLLLHDGAPPPTSQPAPASK